jgi:large subunit ribosomal protein L10
LSFGAHVPKPEKTAVVDEIRSRLSDSDAAVLTEYRGLTVAQLAELRSTLRPAGAEYKVFKNSLARRAVEAAGLTELVPMLEGPVAIAFIQGDAVITAKALRDFGRANPALLLKGGLLGQQVLTGAEVEALADIQPREVLLARIAGGLQAPLTKAAGLFSAFTRNFAYGLKAYADQRSAEAPEVAAPVADVAEAEPATESAEPTEIEQPAATDSAATETEPAEAEQAAAAGVSPDAASDAMETSN